MLGKFGLALALTLVACATEVNTLPPIVVESPAVAEPTSTSTPTPTVSTPTPSSTATPSPTGTTEVAVGKADSNGTVDATPGPWDQPNWGWVRAQWAATGRHDFLTGRIEPCQKLASELKTCFFTEAEGRTIEFGFDSVRTYFVTYPIGDVRNDINERGIDLIIWSKVNGDLLFPLCGTRKIEVFFVEPTTGSQRTWC